jgi:antitoxin component HigA of HigAB toxin-antitoxin module
MAKKIIRPLRSEDDYDAALKEIERYLESEPKPGTSEADHFDLLALVIEDYERRRWPIEPPRQSMRFATAWKQVAIARPILAGCSARASAHSTSWRNLEFSYELSDTGHKKFQGVIVNSPRADIRR